MTDIKHKVFDHTKKIEGRQLASIFDMRSKQAMNVEREILEFLKYSADERTKRWNEYQQMVKEMNRFKVREYLATNIVVTVGRSVIAQRLANILTYTGVINYGALGSSSTAVNNSDIKLGTEVFRKIVASTSFTTNVAFIDFFYSKADTNGTYQEFGSFIDGTGTVDTGQLFSHVLTGGWIKASSESMTVSCQYTQN